MKNLSAAYERILVKDYQYNTITLLSDITEVDDNSAFAYLNITEATKLTINGNGYSIDVGGTINLRGMHVNSVTSETLDLTLQNLTICNADSYLSGDGGAGFYIKNDNAKVTFRDCTVYNNSFTNINISGAGIYCWAQELILQNTDVTGNTLTGGGTVGQGGGVFFHGDSFSVTEGSQISGNVMSGTGSGTTFRGAGLYIEGATTVTMTDARIEANSIGGSGAQYAHGAGVYLIGGSCDFENVYVNDNTISIAGSSSDGRGGGLYLAGSSHIFVYPCFINGNSIASDNSYGAGIYLSSGHATLNGTEVSRNYGTATDTGYGGGIYMGDGTTINMTGGSITNNSANTASNGLVDTKGDGVYMSQVTNGSTFTLNSGDISGNQSNWVTTTAFYLEDSGVKLSFGYDAVIPTSNLVYINDQGTIGTANNLTHNPVASLQFSVFSSYQVITSNAAANHEKFHVMPIGGNGYFINSAGFLTP